jgi:NAD(P)H-dependent FMN reductase
VHNHIEILSLSASDISVSRSCVRPLASKFAALGVNTHCTDIRDLPPVWSSNVKVPDLPRPFTELFNRVRAAAGVVFCVPVYCYATSGAAKTISEIIGGEGGALTRKPVSFIVASGTSRSHLAVRDLMASMAFEQFTYCYPRHVGVQGGDLTAESVPTQDLERRLGDLAGEFSRFCDAIASLQHHVELRKVNS